MIIFGFISLRIKFGFISESILNTFGFTILQNSLIDVFIPLGKHIMGMWEYFFLTFVIILFVG